MRRAARPLLYLGIVVAVVGLSQDPRRVHRRPAVLLHGHVPVRLVARSTSCCSSSTAYGVGLPDLPRTPAPALVDGDRGRGRAGALAISVVQLFVGDALLPRFVVFGSAILLVPWYLLCVGAGQRRPARAAGRDRVLVVSDTVEPADAARGDGPRAPSVPPIVSRSCRSRRSSRRRRATSPWSSGPRRDRATVVVLDREAQASPSRRRPGRRAAPAGRAGAHAVAVLRGVARACCRSPSSSGCRCCSTSARCTARRYGRVKRVLDVVLGAGRRCSCWSLAVPFVVVGDLVGQPGPALLPPAAGRQERRALPHPQVPHDAAAADGSSPNEWTAENDPRITPFGRLLRRDAPRRAAPGRSTS